LTGKIPPEFKKAKVIAILKPGKPPNDASSYRSISLLISVSHKFLEKLIYNRPQNSRFDDGYVSLVMKSGRCSVNYWGWIISYNGMGVCWNVDGRFNAIITYEF
jgi:hypothetical protein